MGRRCIGLLARLILIDTSFSPAESAVYVADRFGVPRVRHWVGNLIVFGALLARDSPASCRATKRKSGRFAPDFRFVARFHFYAVEG